MGSLFRLLLPVLAVAGTLLLTLARAAHAQTPPAMRMPAQQDLEAAREGLPTQDELRAAETARRLGGVPRPPVPPAGAASAPLLDLQQLAEQYQRMQREQRGGGDEEAGAERSASGLLVFVSLSMPRPSLQRLLADAERLRAPLVLRGVQRSSLTATTEAIRALVGERKVAWSIDPGLFKRFGVESVPTLLLIDPARPVQVACGAAHCQRAEFAKVSGDVTLAYALHAIARADPDFAPLAQRYAVRLEGRQ